MWEKGKKKTERGERGEETTECWCCVVGGVQCSLAVTGSVWVCGLSVLPGCMGDAAI